MNDTAMNELHQYGADMKKAIQDFCIATQKASALFSKLTAEIENKEPVTDKTAIILAAVCAEYQITEEQLRSKSRVREFCDARHTVIGLLRSKSSLTLHKIARIINRDHTTIVSSATKHAELMKIDAAYREHTTNILNTLNSI